MGALQKRIKRLGRRVGLRSLGFTVNGDYLGPDLDADQYMSNELAVRLWRLCLRLMAEKEKLERKVADRQLVVNELSDALARRELETQRIFWTRDQHR